MKRLFAVGVLMIALGLVPAAAHAALITTQTFCVAASNPPGESSSCPTGLGATLSISDTNLALNQYDVTLTLDTSAASFTALYGFVQQVQFDLEGYKGNEYDSKPTLDTTLVDGGSWTVFFDNVNNGGGCSSDNTNTQHVCAGSTGFGTDTGDTDSWVFHVDLKDDQPNLTANTDTNLRAVFLNKNGGNGTILSPDFNDIPGTGTPKEGPPTSTPDTTVPEPTSLILLGSGLAYVGSRLRRRRSE